MIGWVFLDVGNVLFNDDPLTFLNHLRHYEAIERLQPRLTFAEFLAGREWQVLAGERWPLYTWMKSVLTTERLDALWAEIASEATRRYDELHPLLDGVPGLIDRLAGRYGLGIIANQATECRASLARQGLLDRFAVVAMSDEIGLHKPDPALFRWAVERAGARPEECVMVGDRHDNDIVPASQVGMHPVWLRWGSWAAKGWHPTDPRARMYLDSMQRVSLYHRVLDPLARPRAVVPRIDAIVPAIQSIGEQGRAGVG